MKVLLADDHRLFRDGLRPLLHREPGVEVVGEAGDGHEALRLVAQLRPDLVLLDVTMPGLNGLETARALTEAHPGVRVVMLTMHADRRFVVEALRAGAVGYVLKEAGFTELLQAMRTVMTGRIALSPQVADLVIADYAAQARLAPEGATPLSSREREVLQAMAEGLSTKEIAFQLGVSVKTVEAHRKAIMDRLDLHSVAELTKYAIRTGLTTLG